MGAITIRPAGTADVAAIRAIYAHHVRHGLASFEIEPPSLDEMRRRLAAITGAGYPYLLAEAAEGVLGYAYASAYRSRPAYRHTVENSVYVAATAVGRGVGRRLLTALIDECTQRGFRQMLAVIGDSANAASIGLHRACGFTLCGTLQSVGFKAGRWVDSVIMQRALGESDLSPPPA